MTLTLFAVIFFVFSQSAQMCWRDFQERSDVFERKEVEEVGMSADKFIVALLRCLDYKST